MTIGAEILVEALERIAAAGTEGVVVIASAALTRYRALAAAPGTDGVVETTGPMTTLYRKRPVLVEAFQMTEARRNDNNGWPHWLDKAWNGEVGKPGSFWCDYPGPGLGDARGERMVIGTLEGAHVVKHGDWIIRGVVGELYPCRADIFEATYEPIAPRTPDAAGTGESARCGLSCNRGGCIAQCAGGARHRGWHRCWDHAADERGHRGEPDPAASPVAAPPREPQAGPRTHGAQRWRPDRVHAVPQGPDRHGGDECLVPAMLRQQVEGRRVGRRPCPLACAPLPPHRPRARYARERGAREVPLRAFRRRSRLQQGPVSPWLRLSVRRLHARRSTSHARAGRASKALAEAVATWIPRIRQAPRSTGHVPAQARIASQRGFVPAESSACLH